MKFLLKGGSVCGEQSIVLRQILAQEIHSCPSKVRMTCGTTNHINEIHDLMLADRRLKVVVLLGKYRNTRSEFLNPTWKFRDKQNAQSPAKTVSQDKVFNYKLLSGSLPKKDSAVDLHYQRKHQSRNFLQENWWLQFPRTWREQF